MVFDHCISVKWHRRSYINNNNNNNNNNMILYGVYSTWTAHRCFIFKTQLKHILISYKTYGFWCWDRNILAGIYGIYIWIRMLRYHDAVPFSTLTVWNRNLYNNLKYIYIVNIICCAMSINNIVLNIHIKNIMFWVLVTSNIVLNINVVNSACRVMAIIIWLFSDVFICPQK